MKDLVENRNRLGLAKKAKLAALAVNENGVGWTSLMGIYYLFSGAAEKAFGLAAKRRERLGLPGMNSVGLNREIWEAWDWGASGEEWSPSEEWKASLIDHILIKHVPKGGEVVEIGPGGGRWTEHLQRRASRLTGIDLSESCVKACQERFAECENVRFYTNSGCDLPGVDDASINAIWSFDVFVHINAEQVEPYAAEFARALKPGGVGIIHHGNVAGRRGGWRSDMTAKRMVELLEAAGLKVEHQITSWTDEGTEYEVGLYDDSVTVFRKP